MWTFGKAGGNKTRRNYGNRRLIQFLLCGPSWKDSRSPSVMFAQRRLAEKDTDTLMDLLDGKAAMRFLIIRFLYSCERASCNRCDLRWSRKPVLANAPT